MATMMEQSCYSFIMEEFPNNPDLEIHALYVRSQSVLTAKQLSN